MKKIFLIFLILLFSCTKTEVVKEQEFVGGVIPDKEELVANIPLIVNKNSLKSKSTSEVSKGRPNRDRQPPSVTITSPATGSTVLGVTTINASASDNVGVTSVTFSVNGSQTVDASAPYSANWDATNVPNGVYTVTATARDAANNTASYSISLVKNVIIVDPPVDTIVDTYEMKTPPIGNQGSEGSCVAWSVGYAARSIDYFYKTGATIFSQATNVFSPEFLYNQVKFTDDCNSGTAMQTALDFIKLNGISTWNSMPYTSGDCSLLPNAEQALAAQAYKINGYYKIYTTDTATIKSMVRQNKAVIISILVDNNFLNAKSGFIWKNTGSGYGFGHSVVITGYNEELKAWKIMNSFGTSWGTNGFAYMEYDMFPTRTGTWCYVIN
jgi:C1A family cysteine protease